VSIYDKQANTALKLLSKFGTDITLKRTTGDSVDPVTGTITAGTDASVPTTGLLRPYPDHVIDGKRIMSGDRELILSYEQMPLPSDRVVIDGEEWSIIGMKAIKPDLVAAVVYFVQVRR
jgi:hypothetical protein